MDALYIAFIGSVPVRNKQTLWRITMRDGQRFSTRNPWQASLCQRAKAANVPVHVWSRAGWFDRELTHVTLAAEEATA